MGLLDATNGSQLFYLLCGHALTDYVLQSPEMSRRKQPRARLFEGPDTVERAQYGPWWWWMLAHSLINGMLVGYLLHWWVLGLLETLVHFGLDTAKGMGKLTTTQDQVGHLLSKVVWMLLG